MKKLIDRRYGERGSLFWVYAFGPFFFAGILVYFVSLYVKAGAAEDERVLFLIAVAILVVVLVVDCLAIYESRWMVQRAVLNGDVIRFKPLWGRAFEVSVDEIKEIRPARSFGYIPAVSLLDNSRANIEIIFKNRSSVFLFGSLEADQWISNIDVSSEGGTPSCD